MPKHRLIYWALRCLIAGVAGGPLVALCVVSARGGVETTLGVDLPDLVKFLVVMVIIAWNVSGIVLNWEYRERLADWCHRRFPPS